MLKVNQGLTWACECSEVFDFDPACTGEVYLPFTFDAACDMVVSIGKEKAMLVKKKTKGVSVQQVTGVNAFRA